MSAATGTGQGNLRDSFCGVGTVLGSTADPTTFQPGTAGGLVFVGGSGLANGLDLTNATGFSTLTAAMSGGTASACGSAPVGQLTSSGGSPDITDSFCNIGIVGGAPSTPSRAGMLSASGVTFAGVAGVTNTLDLTGMTGFSTLTATMSGGAAPVACGTATVGQLTSTGGSPGVTDPFCNITVIDGAGGVPTTFQPGTATNVTFNGSDAAAGGAVVDLSGEPSSSFTSLTVAMSGTGSCAGKGELTSTGTSAITDCLTGVTTVNGASAVSTHFEPDPNLAATPAVVPQFVGNNSLPGGAILDLQNIVTPDANGDALSGLTVSLPENTAAAPGSLTGTVNGSPVTYATFYGITTAIGSSPPPSSTASAVPTTVSPGDVNGVALALIPRAAQPLSFTSNPPSSPSIGSIYTVSATGGASGNPVTFSIDSATTAGTCSMSGATVTFNGGGMCVIDANQLGTHEYAPATEAQQTITVKGPPNPNSVAPVVTNPRVASFVSGTKATLNVTLSEAATLTLAVTEQVSGHRVGKSCKAGVKRHAKRCTVVVNAAKLMLAGAKGSNALKLALTKLAPGIYTGTLTATNSAGQSSQPQTLTFTVKATVHKKRRR
jgi:hypothetical protein